MISFLSAHGFDPGPTQRPLLAGAITGLIAIPPAAAPFVGFGSFRVVVHEIFRIPWPWAAGLLVAAFALGGALYGALFRRAANDRSGGWLFGLAFGFLLWIAAPVVVLPLIGRPVIAAGLAAVGFLVAFLAWGLCVGVLFPRVHEPLHADLDGEFPALWDKLGPNAAANRSKARPGPPPRQETRKPATSGA